MVDGGSWLAETYRVCEAKKTRNCDLRIIGKKILLQFSSNRNTMAYLALSFLVFVSIRASDSACSCNGEIQTPSCDPYKNSNNQYTNCNAMEYLNDLFWSSSSKDWKAGYWNTANTVETSVNYLNLVCPSNNNMTSQCNDILSKLEAVISKDGTLPPTSKVWYDDLGWWSLAFLRMYEYTSNHKYLSDSIVFADYVWHNAWDTNYCQGGLWWSYQKGYKNAITNELGMTTNCKLYYITNNKTYYDRCQSIYSWFMKSGMINSQNLINDGLAINSNDHSSCSNNRQNTWSYNQGRNFIAL